MQFFRKTLAGAIAVIMAAGIMVTAPGAAAAAENAAGPQTGETAQISVVRLGGSDRFETANLIADNGWTSAETVFLANSGTYADALAGTPLAHAYNAPILLTYKEYVPRGVMSEIQKLGAKNVYLLGGTAAISADVEKYLTDNNIKVSRIWGATRYETAVEIAKALEAKGQAPADVFIASGVNYPDALSASSPAALKYAPILYAPADGRLDKASAEYLAKSKPVNAYILGGTAAVGLAAETAVKDAGVQNVSRVGGSDRYETSLRIAKQFDPQFKADDVAFATGRNFPDALAGSVLAARKSIPVLLTDNSGVRRDVKEYIDSRTRAKAYVFGGTAVVADSSINGYTGNVKDVTDTLSAADKKAVADALGTVSSIEINENVNTAQLLYRTLLCPPWVSAMGLAQDYFPVSFNIIEYNKTADPRKQFKDVQKYAKCSGSEADKLLSEYFNLTAKHENNKPADIYYQNGYYYLPFGGYGDLIRPEISVDSVYDIGSGKYYVKYTADKKAVYAVLAKKTVNSRAVWSYVRNSASDFYYIAAKAPVEEPELDLDKYVGEFICDRCGINVKKTGNKNELSFDISWGASAFENVTWTMSGVLDNTGKVAYSNSKKVDHIYSSDGKETTTSTIYTGGAGSFVFADENSVRWTEEKDPSAKDMLFKRAADVKEEGASVEDGSLVIRVAAADGSLAWSADEMAQDDTVLKYKGSEAKDGFFTASYAPAGNGTVNVSVRHYYSNTICDELRSWDVTVKEGKITDISEMSLKKSPEESAQDALLSGDWQEDGTPYTLMTVAKNESKGWNVEITSPISRGAYIFKATVYYDCELDSFVYNKGKFFDIPLNGSGSLGEAKIMGATGYFKLNGTSKAAKLAWHGDAENSSDVIDFIFVRVDPEEIDTEKFTGTYVWDRCSIDVSATDIKNELSFEVKWSSGALSTTVWNMSGTVDLNTGKVEYTNSRKVTHNYDSAGKDTPVVEYENGTGSFEFDENNLIWNEDKDTSAKGKVFALRGTDYYADKNDEAVNSAVEEYLMKGYSKKIEAIIFNNVKVLSEEEIAAIPALEEYKIGDKDLVFEISYDIKVADGVDIREFTAGNGEEDGRYVRNISRVGIVRYSDGKYTLDSRYFGTGY